MVPASHAISMARPAAYEAAARLLGDLKLLWWTVRADACGIELSVTAWRVEAKGGSLEDIQAAKDQVRKELAASLARNSLPTRWCDILFATWRNLRAARAGAASAPSWRTAPSCMPESLQ